MNKNIITYECYAVNNNCFKSAMRKKHEVIPQGIIIHSTGCNNPNLSRYVDYPELVGENKYGNHWNVPKPLGPNGEPREQCCHAMIGYDKDREVIAVKLLPWKSCAWNCGEGRLGSYNFAPPYIQIEILEDDLTDAQYFNDCFNLAAKLCARLMMKYPIIIENIISHKEAFERGYASSHVDPEHWLAKYKMTMDDFRALVVRHVPNMIK